MLKSDEGGNVSYWEATAEDAGGSGASEVRETDVCIIGGGISGLTTAYLLSRAGKRVTFIPADMNHQTAREKARKRGQAEPTDFRGSAHLALAKGT